MDRRLDIDSHCGFNWRLADTYSNRYTVYARLSTFYLSIYSTVDSNTASSLFIPRSPYLWLTRYNSYSIATL